MNYVWYKSSTCAIVVITNSVIDIMTSSKVLYQIEFKYILYVGQGQYVWLFDDSLLFTDSEKI